MTHDAEGFLTQEERLERAKRLKRKRKFRLSLVIAGFLLILCILLSPVIVFTAFRIKSIEINGKIPYTKEEICGAAGIRLEDNLITADAEKIEADIENGLPYIYKAEVTKKLPGTLRIKVTKATERYALYMESTKTYLVTDKDLQILKSAGTVPKGAGILRMSEPVKKDAGATLAFVADGKEQTEDSLLTLLQKITAALQNEKAEKITVIDLRKPGDIQIIYDGRILLKIGSQSDLESKINLAVQVIAQENTINPSQNGTVDLTITKKAFFKPNAFDYLMPGEEAKPITPEDETTDSSEENDGDEITDDESTRDEETEEVYASDGGQEEENSESSDDEETRSYDAEEDSDSESP